MNSLYKKNLLGISLLLLIMLAMVAIPAYAADSMSGAAKTEQNNVTIDIVAKGFAFNASTVTVPIGANVTINFNNMDAGVPHNVAIYQNQDAKKAIFVGDVINGPKAITYNFVAPTTAGTYFFRCDVHPTTMTGDFIVK